MVEHCRFINENILYVSKTLRFCEYIFLNENSSLTDVNFNEIVIKKLNYAINVCLHCNSSEENDNVKYDIFYYLIGKYYGQKYSILSPVCNFDIIHYLMITCRFKDFVRIIENFIQPIQSEVCSNLIKYLDLTVMDESRIEEVYLFSVKTLITTFDKANSSNSIAKLSVDLESLVYRNFYRLNAKDYLNDVLTIMTKFDQKIDVLSSNSKESSLRDSIFEKEFSSNYNRFLKLLNLLNFLSNGFNTELADFKLENLNSIFYLLSFLLNKQNTLCPDENGIDLFIKFLKNYLKLTVGVDFDIYFIIQHHLYGYLNLIHQNILNENLIINQANKFSYSFYDVIVLETELEQLKEPKNLYLISRILKMNNKINNKILKARLKNIFWNLFTSLNLVQRIEGIKLIYENLEADDDNNNWNKNLIQDSFNQDSVILINQISAENSNKNDVCGNLIFLLSLFLLIIKFIDVESALSFDVSISC